MLRTYRLLTMITLILVVALEIPHYILLFGEELGASVVRAANFSPGKKMYS